MNQTEPRVVTTGAKMESFRDAYCRKHRCAGDDFLRHVFWRALYPQAWPVCLVAGFRADCFAADRSLIDYCGRLTSLRQIDVELVEFAVFRNHGLVRRHGRIRVSGRRLRNLAEDLLDP